MRKRWLALIAVCAGVLFTTGAQVSEAQQPGAGMDSRYVVVQYDRPHGRAIRAFGQRPPTLQEAGFEQVEVPPGKTASEFAAELRRDPEVIAAEPSPSGAVQAAFVPNDPYYAAVGQNQASYLEQIGAASAWDLTTGDDGIVVAVLDSGLDLAHGEFAGSVWENSADADGDGIDDDQNGCIDDRYGCRFVNTDEKRAPLCGYLTSSTGNLAYGDVRDDHAIPGSQQFHSHGTMVSGVLGAHGNNGQGVAGMAWDIKIMPVKVLDCGRPSGALPEGDAYNLAEGIDYAVRMGADIINMSLAASRDFPEIRAAVANAQAAGVLVVAATGNAGSGDVGVLYPAAYTEFSNVIAVGATSNKVSATTWASYSRYGPPVDFAAPATDLLTTARSDLSFAIPYFSTGEGGTSFATPLASGLFALMMSRNPYLTAAEYIQIARDTATPPSPAPHGQNWAGSGIINAGAAVARVPMTISGSALHDWLYVPNGTDVRARIDGADCGSTTTQNSGVISFFPSLRVKSASEQPGCGAPGKTVQIYVGGSPAQPTYTWGGLNQQIGFLAQEVSSVTPPPGQVVVQTLNGGWSNIAVLDPSGELPDALSSLSGWTAVYRWDPSLEGFEATQGAYRRFALDVPEFVNTMDSVATYESLWVNAPAGPVAMLNPNPQSSRTASLQPGWNNIVYTGTSKEVKDALSGIAGKYSLVLQYDNAALSWRIHVPGQARYLNDFGGLFKLQAYWIFMTQPALLIMN